MAQGDFQKPTKPRVFFLENDPKIELRGSKQVAKALLLAKKLTKNQRKPIGKLADLATEDGGQASGGVGRTRWRLATRTRRHVSSSRLAIAREEDRRCKREEREGEGKRKGKTNFKNKFLLNYDFAIDFLKL